jgi:hypothetical protein
VLVPRNPFQLSLMFAGKAAAYLIDDPLEGQLLSLPTNIRLGWKGTLDDNEHLKIRM